MALVIPVVHNRTTETSAKLIPCRRDLETSQARTECLGEFCRELEIFVGDTDTLAVFVHMNIYARTVGSQDCLGLANLMLQISLINLNQERFGSCGCSRFYSHVSHNLEFSILSRVSSATSPKKNKISDGSSTLEKTIACGC